VLGYAYGQRALLEVVLVGALAGAVGVHVVLRRLSFFTMAMTHATFPGVVLAAVLGLNLYLGSATFGVLVVLALVALRRRPEVDTSSAIGVVLAGGFAVGVLLISAQPGFSKDLTAYLVGSVLTVQPADLILTAGVGAAVLATLALLSKELLYAAFDPEGLAAAGYPATGLDLVLLLLVQLTIVISVPAVGTILSVALIVGPAATARLWCHRIGPMIAVAVSVGVASGVTGLAVSQHADVAAGGAVVLVAGLFFAVSLAVAPRWGRPVSG
jgi:ABC-type Mn2+/Zn2+ transport system permease subunit